MVMGSVAQVDTASCLQGSTGDDASTRPPSGKVVGIIKRAWRTRGYCGALAPPRPGDHAASGRSKWVRVLPKDHRVPPILIRTAQVDQLLQKNIVVVIEEWEPHRRLPSGRYVRTIGAIGDREAETVRCHGFTAKILIYMVLL